MLRSSSIEQLDSLGSQSNDSTGELLEDFRHTLQESPRAEVIIDFDDLPTDLSNPEDILSWVEHNPNQAKRLEEATDKIKQILSQNGSEEGDFIVRIERGDLSSGTTFLDNAEEGDFLSEEDPSSDSSDEQQEQSTCQKVAGKVRLVIYTIPFMDAAQEAMQTMIGLSSKPLGLNIPITLINFFSALGIDIKYDVAGTEDILLMIKTRQLPNDWVKDLTKRQEIMAATLAAFLASLSCFADSVQNYHFCMELPDKMKFRNYINGTGWKALSVIGAIYTAISIISGEGMATWKESREMVKGVKRDFSCELSRYVSGILGRSLGVADSASDAAFSYAGLQYIFQLENTIALYALATGSMLSAVTHYSTEGTTIVDFMDDFFGAFISRDNNPPAVKQPKNLVTFGISAGMGGLFAYAIDYLIRDTMVDVVENLPFRFPALTGPFVEVLAYTGAAAAFIKSTGTLFPFTYAVLDKAQSSAGRLYEKARDCYHGNSDMIETDPLLVAEEGEVAHVLHFPDSSDDSEESFGNNARDVVDAPAEPSEYQLLLQATIFNFKQDQAALNARMQHDAPEETHQNALGKRHSDARF